MRHQQELPLTRDGGLVNQKGVVVRQLREARPTPALVVAILALVATLAGTAVAGDDNAITKKKVIGVITSAFDSGAFVFCSGNTISAASQP
jgi:hypothetical protein